MIQKFKTLDDAIELAFYAHRHQTDKAGLPYFKHPKRVMKSVQAQGGLPYVQMAAILHDVTEDTAFTCSMLLALGFPEGAVEIVRLVDRDYSRKGWELDTALWKTLEDEPPAYMESAESYYYHFIKANPGALMVKLADINDNLQEWRLTYLPAETQARLREKYAKAKVLLGVGNALAMSGIEGAVPA
jgi:(p)ppGpp synthase/HD superfamily hydrolase